MITVSGRKQPSSTRSCGVVRHLIRNRHALTVIASPQLNGPATCGLEPRKSTVIPPFLTVIAISTRTGRARSIPALAKSPAARYGPAGRGERGRRAALRLVEVDLRRTEHGVAPVLAEHLVEVGLAGAAHRDHRLDVLERAALGADVALDDPHHLVVELAAAEQADRP